mmetsp:Transcript_23997/g.33022  ORF Transcript_23997/g.33022 Transcript_23997/m.33022 type:complete len:153 (-) Transcript_23997:265-723(-)|eukprot:CAMPEP_0196576008 /NCGR_PEP_ID=MMETSP1081-20130531/5380_1 /TAXON_ID=36882 /ORGANISM="Pyramimonas amylifera, Strain CCMP720" /LENGTH=152 /DNA_ID=CAMNT_0041894489 /DNA_START=120 /DNA_END=578 /DNA_ORIENTATION=-
MSDSRQNPGYKLIGIVKGLFNKNGKACKSSSSVDSVKTEKSPVEVKVPPPAVTPDVPSKPSAPPEKLMPPPEKPATSAKKPAPPPGQTSTSSDSNKQAKKSENNGSVALYATMAVAIYLLKWSQRRKPDTGAPTAPTTQSPPAPTPAPATGN